VRPPKLAVAALSYRYDGKSRIEEPQVLRVGGKDLLAGSAGADDDVGVRDVGRTARSQKSSDVRGIDPVKRYDVGGRLAEEPPEARLALRPPDGLGKSTRRDRDASRGLASPCEEHQDSAVVAVNGNQRPGVQRDTRHYAAGLLALRRPPRTSSAQRRSSRDSPPPVSERASASMAPQPATSSRATPMAWRTNPDTLEAAPASTKDWMRSRWSSSTVTVTFFVAIPITIPWRAQAHQATRGGGELPRSPGDLPPPTGNF
jgi:hypothetical protein